MAISDISVMDTKTSPENAALFEHQLEVPALLTRLRGIEDNCPEWNRGSSRAKEI